MQLCILAAWGGRKEAKHRYKFPPLDNQIWPGGCISVSGFFTRPGQRPNWMIWRWPGADEYDEIIRYHTTHFWPRTRGEDAKDSFYLHRMEEEKDIESQSLGFQNFPNWRQTKPQFGQFWWHISWTNISIKYLALLCLLWKVIKVIIDLVKLLSCSVSQHKFYIIIFILCLGRGLTLECIITMYVLIMLRYVLTLWTVRGM